MDFESAFEDMARDTLRFDYYSGKVSPMVCPHDTGWRKMPWTLCAQIMGDLSDVHLSNGEIMTVSTGEAFVIPEGVPHRCVLRRGGMGLSRWAHFKLNFLGGVDAFRFHKLPTVFNADIGQRLGDLCETLAEDWTLYDSGFSLERIVERQALGMRLASTVLRNSKPRPDALAAVRGHVRLLPALKRLESIDSGKASVRELAGLCGLSQSHFSLLFQRAMKCGPAHYQTHFRLMKAYGLLLNTNMSIADIAKELDYKDQFHFSKSFRKAFGRSPLSCRKRLTGYWGI